MVEGPGCKLKGEAIRRRLKGRIATGVGGNAVNRETKKKQPDGSDTTSQFHCIVGQKLDEVQSLGKELFMFFGENCLRAHFLMAGSFRVNGQQLDNDHCKLTETPSFEIQMDKDVLAFYKTSVEIRPSSACKQKYENLKHLDICSPCFQHSKAVQEILHPEEQDRLVCDVLLDQMILPGVGNIIKNEALFDSGISPSSKISELTEAHVSHLVKMTRDFSMLFYECRKTGKTLSKHCKVYNKGSCGQCSSKLVMCRLGEDSPRVTYFCGTCQNNELDKRKQRNLPSKNSLLGWISGSSLSNDSTAVTWTCAVCTLINKGCTSMCAACGEPIVREKQTNMNEVQTKTSEQQTKNMENKPKLNNKQKQGTKRSLTDDIATNCSDTGDCASDIQPAKRFKNEASQSESKIPVCKTHKIKCVMREVRKKGENEKRMFFACSLSRGKQCNFFEWADINFPVCNHNKKVVLRTVLKQGPNNRRKFFTCGQNKNKQCGFFQWAEGYG